MKLQKNIDLLILSLIALNVLVIGYIAFFKKDALWLETLKSGGSENFTLVQQIYNNDAYQTQQRESIQKGIETFANAQTK